MKKILLVEDNDLILEMLGECLETQGFEVIGAHNGVEAVRLALEERPDLILMDLAMPEVDGWEATQRIRRQSETSEIPIIAVTAHTTGEERDQSLLAGCNDFEPKPINFERLVNKIHRWTEENKTLRVSD